MVKAASVQANDVASFIEKDTEFHEMIYKASRNERLMQIISNLREQINRFRMVSLAYPCRGKEALEEHKKLPKPLLTVILS